MTISHQFLYLLAWLAVGVLSWLALRWYLRRATGMVKQMDSGIETGRMLRKSRWGSGTINGIGFKGCLQIIEYEEGWLLRTMWFVGGGHLWLPRNATEVGDEVERKWLLPRYRAIVSGSSQIRLREELADFMV